ncbi:MAG: glycosyltransferase [Lachnospiraceae bacterium]|nr:glycosyltransferase [Lachnospiraceae bacterium]
MPEDVKKAEVLLSYYNGSKYIKEQISSIVNQSWPGKIRIMIRDDGTPEDATGFQLDNWISAQDFGDNREVVYVKGENLGPQRSFLKLIEDSGEADYYFFSDQDDHWMPEKVERCIARLEGKNQPALYCSNYSITDTDLKVEEKKAVSPDDKTFHFLRAVFFNTFPGCTMGFNRGILDNIRKLNLSDCMMHDSVAFAVAIATGEVCYDDEPMIMHRIHESNVIGLGYRKSSLRQWIQDKTAILKEKERYKLSAFAEELSKLPLKAEWESDVKTLAEYNGSFRKRMKLLLHSDLKRTPDRWSLSVWCRILFGLY